MNAKAYLSYFLPRTLGFAAARRGLMKAGNPITLTFSITAACQSKCKTCNIGLRYRESPERNEKDLKLHEIERVFSSLGRIYFCNISGGEPFLRHDLPEIIGLACRYLRPGIIHIPTNAIASRTIRDKTLQCLEVIRRHSEGIPLTVKPSIDGVGTLHDEIRGVKGNFARLRETIGFLKEIEKEHENFHLELGTVVSRFNMERLSEIENYVHSLGVQSYRNEIAEQRAEFFNRDDAITPDAETYAMLIEGFKDNILRNVRAKRILAKVTESFRMVYYDLAVRILREGRQVIPCYGGISNVHINYDGEVWPCCVLGYDRPMGFLREEGYDFQKIWNSEKAREVRKYIREKNCACPLANQAYSNILCSPGYLLRLWHTMFHLMKR